MNIMLNFLPLKTGGGVQVALDFLQQAKRYGGDHKWFLVARAGGPFSDYQGTYNISVVELVKDNLASRLYFEYFGCKPLLKRYSPDVVYTQFGPHWPGCDLPNVAGCAYSNLFYPELNFWGALPLRKRVIKKLIDSQRLSRILKADVRVFETQDLAERAKEQYQLPSQGVTYVRAAASSLVTPDSRHEQTKLKCEQLPNRFKVLLLSGYHPNKNIEFLVDTATELKKKQIDDICFVLTLPEHQTEVIALMQKVETLGLQAYIYNFGTVPQEGCCELYRACDAAILPSTLESFSNMIAESWAMSKPLFMSDLSWCRSLCNEGALYYQFLDSNSLIEKIQVLKAELELQQALIEKGLVELQKYPTARQRFESYLSIIEAAVE